MATRTRKKGNTGKRYTERQKNTILAFVRAQGRGGITAAGRKFGVSYIALRRWMGGKTGGKGKGRVKAGLDGRKLRRVRSAVIAVKLIQRQVTSLQKTLKKLAG